MSSSSILDRAAEFVRSQARLLERRRFAHAFLGGSSGAVVDVLRAYVNEDGGFGHALEPDSRAPTSQPLFADFALQVLEEIGEAPENLVNGLTQSLSTVADTGGAVPYLMPDARNHARAGHWRSGDFGYAPSLHATSAVVAGLHALGASHPWLDRATQWCFAALDGRPELSGARMKNILRFLEHIPDRERTKALRTSIAPWLFEADYVQFTTPVTQYTLTPLHFAPRPDAPDRELFDDDVIEAHLDDLVARQEQDGGWPIHWNPPAGAATSEWRGIWTIEALLALRAYGRL